MLADEFWWLAHDDVTGEPRLAVRAVGWGLAAGLLAELLYEQRIRIAGGLVYLTGTRTPPRDAVAHAVFDQIKAESGRLLVRDWLAFLTTDAYGRVAGRLVTAGHVAARTSGFWPLRSTRYVPVDVKTSGWPLARLALGLRLRKPVPFEDVFLIGLAEATGLDGWLIRDAMHRDWVRSYVRHLLTSLPAEPAQLLAQTRAAVGNALVAHHT
jgi:hypothetical protein